MQGTIFRFNANRVRKILEEYPMAKSWYEMAKYSGKSDIQALRQIFKEIIMEDPRLKEAYDGGRTRKKLGRAPIHEIPFISKERKYRENWKTVDKIAGRLGCDLSGFNPDWLIHYKNHPMVISYEVMRELALILGHKWQD